jgi:glycosyltransferase involved in cell wall biosynthesis
VVTSERGIICRAGDVDAYVNALKKLLQSSELRQDMGRNACKYAEDHHDIRSQSQKLVRIYNSVMHNGL